jgi:predicted acetyltransferase
VNIEVTPAGTEHKSALANLLELYQHDFSEFVDVELGQDGRFGYKYLPLYWSEPNRFPFLIQVDGKLAGFALVRRGSEVSGNRDVWDMAEFFVVRGYRKRGVGTRAAHQVWRRCPGKWEIRVMPSNESAREFWSAAVARFVGRKVPSVLLGEADKRWQVISFESPPMA